MFRNVGIFGIFLSFLIACTPMDQEKTDETQGAGSTDSLGISEAFVYIGTYTRGESEGIYVFRINLDTGTLTPVAVQSGIVNPSFLAVHPNHQNLYAVTEVEEFADLEGGGVAAFGIDQETGLLTHLNQQPSMGKGPCHVSVDRSGKHVLVANYGGGSVTVIPIGEGGKLGEPTCSIKHEGSSVDPERQQKPYAHSINLDPAGRFAFAADLGTDRILVYQLDQDKGTLTPHDVPWASVAPGSGPRHFTFRTDGKYAYVINEMACTITGFSYDSDRGVLTKIQTVSTLPEGIEPTQESTAEVLLSPSGRFLYGSNRGHDSIVVFEVDPDTGTLGYVEHEPTQGRTPRNFGIDPSGRFLLAANQDSDTVVVFRIDPSSGKLEPTGEVIEVPAPVCVKFLTRGLASTS